MWGAATNDLSTRIHRPLTTTAVALRAVSDETSRCILSLQSITVSSCTRRCLDFRNGSARQRPYHSGTWQSPSPALMEPAYWPLASISIQEER